MFTHPILRDGKPVAACAVASAGLLPESGVGGVNPAAAGWICVASARNVLVVDDNDRHLDIIATILSSVGHDVETCGSGAEAIRRLETHRFDVVVLDVVMPGISGIDVAEHMRRTRLNCDTPIIFCTAHTTTIFPAPLLPKPIDTASLVLAVARVG